MLKTGIKYYEVQPESLEREYAARDIVDGQTGEVILRAGDPFTVSALEKCTAAGIIDLEAIFSSGAEVSSCMRDTLVIDKCEDMESAQVDIYKRLRPSSPPTPEIASSFFDNLFRNPDYYDLFASVAMGVTEGASPSS